MEKDFYFEQQNELHEALSELSKTNPNLAAAMKDDLKSVDEESNNILMVGTNGDVAVTIIHVPRSAIYNKRGPILLPTTDKHRVVAAVSREAIEEWMERPENQAIDPLIMDSKWEMFLQGLFEEAVAMNEKTPHPVFRDIDPLIEEF